MLPLSTSTISKAHPVGKEDSRPEKIRSQPRRRGDARRTVQLSPGGTTTMSRLFKTPSPAPKGKLRSPTYRPLRPAAPTYSRLTHARCDSPSRNQNTGAVAPPVFSYSRPGWTRRSLMASGVGLSETQKAPSRIAPTNTNTAHTASTLSFDLRSTRRTSIRVVLAGRLQNATDRESKSLVALP
jgi:hypothetical protein